MSPDQMVLFESESASEQGRDRFQDAIFVDNAKMLSTEQTSWQCLFDGYETLQAIVFVADLKFLKKLLPRFKEATVIIGCSALLADTARKLIAHQRFVFERTDEDPYLVNRIKEGTLRIAVTNYGLLSHEKIYVMSSESSDKTRIVTGSANLSERAWNGTQLENYTVYDDDGFAFSAYQERFRDLLEMSTTDITIKDVEAFDRKKTKGTATPADAVPAIQKVKRTKHAVVLELDQSPDNRRYSTALITADETFKDYVPEKLPTKGGLTVIDTSTVERIEAKRRKVLRERKASGTGNPVFIIDYRTGSFSYNGKPLDTSPSSEQVTSDMCLLKSYFDGFDCFNGDTNRMRDDYCKALTWMFASPFIPYLRMRAADSDFGNYASLFPSYLFIAGASNAGKTRFVKTIETLMHGEPGPSLSRDQFAWKDLRAYQMSLRGLTVLLDEMDPTRFSQAKKYVKDESYLIRERKDEHPTFVILSNDMRGGLEPSIAKRMLYLDIANSISADEGARLENPTERLRAQMSDALYRAYLPLMLERVRDICDKMDANDGGDWIPDMFEASSDCIILLLDKFDIQLQGMRRFTWYDCCGDKPHAAEAVKVIRDLVELEKRAVRVDRKRDVVEIDMSVFKEPKVRKQKGDRMRNGLPLQLEEAGRYLVIHDVERLESIVGVRFPLRTRFRRR